MNKKVVALVDCNNFYVSCERAFQVALQNRPVVVLSNNDGCVVARSNESKKLGIKMGQPYFQCQDIIRQHNVQVFSSNYSLYADMSARVMHLLSQFAPAVEVYSIDEAFLDLPGLAIEDFTEFGRTLKASVMQLTSIPVSVGIAPTKSLAKVATEIVKKDLTYDGVLDFTRCSSEQLGAFLERVSIEDIWGDWTQIYAVSQQLRLPHGKRPEICRSAMDTTAFDRCRRAHCAGVAWCCLHAGRDLAAT